MNTEKQKLNCRDKMFFLNIIAQKEAEKAAIIAEKNAVIEYYKRAAEMATRSKHRAINRHDEQRKDVIAWGICIACIAFAVWLGAHSVHEILLWASGR